MLHSDISASVAHKVTWFECFVLTVHVLSECDKNWRRLSNLNTLQPTDFNRRSIRGTSQESRWQSCSKNLEVYPQDGALSMSPLTPPVPIYLPTDTDKVVVDDYLLALLPMCTCAAGKKAISPSYHHTKFTMDTAAVTVLQWRRYHRQTRQHNAGRPSGARTLEHTTFVCMCVWSWLCCILVKGFIMFTLGTVEQLKDHGL